MNKPDRIDDRLLGERDATVCEPRSIEEVVRQARSMGFSDVEIARLRAYFDADAERVIGDSSTSARNG